MSNTDFKNRPNKRKVQEHFFNKVNGIHNATVLLGPNPKEQYIPLLRKYITKNKGIIYGYDFEPTINSSKDLVIYPTNICWAEATSFIDLDLCSTISTGKYLMFSLFEKQTKLNNKGKEKIFMVTLCRRGNRRDMYHTTHVFNAIAEMIDRKIEVTYKKTQLGTEYILSRKPKGYDIDIIAYNDTGASMITVMIKYK